MFSVDYRAQAIVTCMTMLKNSINSYKLQIYLAPPPKWNTSQ